MLESPLAIAIALISLILTTQAIFTLALMLYTWMHPERLQQSCSPEFYARPKLSFTAILPARHEREVIAQTIRRIWDTRYPKELIEVVVVCEAGDVETIAEAQHAIDLIGHPNLRVVTFTGEPINKPRGLNVALAATRNDVVTVFDAEDDVHPEVFWIVNTIMTEQNAGVVQAGVQLMDFQSRWFSVHNVLEYYFWFKSRLHFHARVGMVPLGGNTVFMRRRLIERVGGWDDCCLTEDADIGLRLSALHEPIAVTYDSRHTTREETPPTLDSFVRQRTRWNQGFLQILKKGTWRALPTRTQRTLAVYTLAYPFIQSFVGLLWLPALVAMFFVQVPVIVAMLSLLPLYGLGFQYLTNLVGLFEFARTYQLHVRPRDVLVFTAGFPPYQFLLTAGAVRAVYREARGATNWEKTAHLGAHRSAFAYVGAALHRLLDEAAERHGVERGTVHVPGPSGSLTVCAARGVPADAWRIAQHVAESREPIVDQSRDILADTPDESRSTAGSSIVVPVERGDQLVAVVSVSSRKTRLGPAQLDWLRARASELLAAKHLESVS